MMEDWDAEIAEEPRPEGRLVYMGQGQIHYTFFHEGTPDPLWPKKKRKKKKKKTRAPQIPPPAPPIKPPEVQPQEDWDAEMGVTEDWDAEIAASH